MADVNYIITIKSDGDGSSHPSPHIAPSASGGSGSSMTSDSSTAFSSFGKTVARMAPVAFALKMADLQITTHINRVDIRTGNALLQEKMQYQYEATKSLAMSTIAGFMAGGPVGAAVGLAANVLNRVISNEIQEETLRLNRAVDGIGIAQAMVRAGAYGNRRT